MIFNAKRRGLAPRDPDINVGLWNLIFSTTIHLEHSGQLINCHMLPDTCCQGFFQDLDRGGDGNMYFDGRRSSLFMCKARGIVLAHTQNVP